MNNLEEWVLTEMSQHGHLDGDWKLVLDLKTNTDGTSNRIFLRHHGFQEYPIKTTCHCANNKKYFTTLLPYHPTQKIHVTSERIIKEVELDTENESVVLSCVQVCEEEEEVVAIQETCIEHGSIFKRNDLELVITLVEKTYMEEYGHTLETKSSPSSFHIYITWKKATSQVNLRKILVNLGQVLSWFDF